MLNVFFLPPYNSLFLVCVQSVIYGLKGQKVNLKPHITGHPDEILWKHKGNKVVEFDGKQQQVYSLYENRVTLDWVSAELNISDLRYEDSGQYEVETYTNTEGFSRSYYVLEVIGKFQLTFQLRSYMNHILV